MLGFALGCVGLGYDDFCRLTPGEFKAVSDSFIELREADRREDWERMRILATVTIQPHIKNKLTAKKLLPLPWDNEVKTAEIASKEESLGRLNTLNKTWLT